MKMLIVGTGVAGGIIGSRIIENGCEVTFVAAPSRRANLNAIGLTIASPFGRFRKRVRVIDAEDVAPHHDLAILAVRAQEYEAAAQLAVGALLPEAKLLTVVEGNCHLEAPLPTWPMQRFLAGVFEGRVTLDADGVIHQRPPEAMLSIGGLNSDQDTAADELALVLSGRGLKTVATKHIASKPWERFGYLAAGIAAAQIMGRPLRDALRFTGGPRHLALAANECWKIGLSAGYHPNLATMSGYQRAFSLDAFPVLPPSLATCPGRAGDEAVYLLSEMVGIARRERVNAPTLENAWRSLKSAGRVGIFTLAGEEAQHG